MGIAFKYDLTGMKFGLLTVAFMSSQRNKWGDILWVCECECGRSRLSTTGSLRHGGNTSCGCINNKGEFHRRLKPTWSGMIARCYRPKSTSYKNYGAKGITVCDEWHDYEVFKKWAIESGYNENLSLDRFPDGKGNYSPSNCRWATDIEQANNRSGNRFIEIDGQQKTIADWSRISGINQVRIARRIKLGWSNEDAVFKQIDKNKISKIYR